MGLESGYPAENMLISIALPSQQCPSERLLLIEVLTVELFALSTKTAMNQSFIFLENALCYANLEKDWNSQYIESHLQTGFASVAKSKLLKQSSYPF